MKIIAVIPVRLNSKRFPNKALHDLGGVSLIERVYKAVISVDLFDKVVVATDSKKIIDCVRQFNGNVIETSSKHRSGTERIAELLEAHSEYDVFVNVQGDQPFLEKSMIDALLAPYLSGELLNMTTVACTLRDQSDLSNSDVVKVLVDQHGNALLFSRSNIPYVRKEVDEVPVYHHLGLYAFSKDFLHKYRDLEPTPLETCESLEQMRVLEHGYKIRVNIIDKYVPEINTPADIKLAEDMNLI